jgi:hypothetical protein
LELEFDELLELEFEELLELELEELFELEFDEEFSAVRHVRRASSRAGPVRSIVVFVAPIGPDANWSSGARVVS